jgi:hypothetical protein
MIFRWRSIKEVPIYENLNRAIRTESSSWVQEITGGE